MKYKLVKKSKHKIKHLQDPESKEKVCPEDVMCSDNLNDVNINFLEGLLDRRLSKKKKTNYLFEFLDDINLNKKMLVKDEEYLKNFNPVVIMRILSFSPECIFSVNEINTNPGLGKYEQYKYLSDTIRKKKRYISTNKKSDIEEISIIRSLYGLGISEAKMYYELICKINNGFPDEIREDYDNLNNKNKKFAQEIK